MSISKAAVAQLCPSGVNAHTPTSCDVVLFNGQEIYDAWVNNGVGSVICVDPGSYIESSNGMYFMGGGGICAHNGDVTVTYSGSGPWVDFEDGFLYGMELDCSGASDNCITVSFGLAVLHEMEISDTSNSDPLISAEDRGVLHVLDSTFKSNGTGLTDGSVIALGGLDAELHISGSLFEGNESRDGGVIHLEQASELHIGANTVFSQNEASGEGGAIWMNDVDLVSIAGQVRFEFNLADQEGGAIYASQIDEFSSVGTEFLGNESGGDGGALWISDSQTSVLVDDALFMDNISSLRGGAMYAEFVIGFELRDSDLLSNMSTLDGGAVWLGSAIGLVEFQSNRFEENKTDEDGGAIWMNTIHDEVYIYDNVFVTNSALGDGGAVLARSPFFVTGSSFDDNSASNGGAIALRQSTTNPQSNIERSVVHDNHANGDGGGILNDSAGLLLRTVSIYQNTANGDGGGIAARGNLSLTHVTVSGNSSDADSNASGHGGGIHLADNLDIDFSHLLLAGNTDNNPANSAPDLDEGEFLNFDFVFGLLGDNTGTNIAEALVGAPDADGNLVGDPTGSGVILAGLASLDGQLLADSPAVDVGNPVLLNPPLYDLIGHPRVQDGDNNETIVIDIGAHELLGNKIFGSGFEPLVP